jgi:hypothetical protein
MALGSAPVGVAEEQSNQFGGKDAKMYNRLTAGEAYYGLWREEFRVDLG